MLVTVIEPLVVVIPLLRIMYPGLVRETAALVVVTAPNPRYPVVPFMVIGLLVVDITGLPVILVVPVKFIVLLVVYILPPISQSPRPSALMLIAPVYPEVKPMGALERLK